MLTRDADEETLLGLVEHESVALRGYLVVHLVERLRHALERLYPLFRDDRTLCTLRGCRANRTRVGAHLAQHLMFLMALEGGWFRDVDGTTRARLGDARSRGARPHGASTPALEELLGDTNCSVQQGAARGLAALSATGSLGRLRASLPGTVPTVRDGIAAAIQHLESIAK